MKTDRKPFWTTRDLVFYALCTAIAVVGRIAFQWIPNVQPMTAIFLLMSVYEGLLPALLVSISSVTITSFYFGFGVWTISQWISYTCIVIVFWLLYKIPLVKKYAAVQAILAGAMGFLYGAIISLSEVYVFGMSRFIVYYLAGLSFDALHAGGNIAFYLIFLPFFGNIWVKRRRK